MWQRTGLDTSDKGKAVIGRIREDSNEITFHLPIQVSLFTTNLLLFVVIMSREKVKNFCISEARATISLFTCPIYRGFSIGAGLFFADVIVKKAAI